MMLDAHDPRLAAPAAPERWPTVVGGVSLGWGLLQLFGGVCSMIAMSLGVAGSPSASLQEKVHVSTAWTIASAVLGYSNVLLLIGAGAALIARHPIARRLHLVWAVIAVVTWMISMGVMAATLPQLRQWAMENPNDPAAKGFNSQGVTALVALMFTFSMLLHLAWPGFCLVWFELMGRGRPAAAVVGADASPMRYPGQER